MPSILAHVYFCLTDAYKAEFLKDGHRTDGAKRAAITCATLSYVAPLRPPPGTNIVEADDSYEGSLYLYANPMLAMRAASTLVKHPFNKRPFDDRRRIYSALRGLKFPSVDWIIDEAINNDGVISSSCAVKLTEQEMANLSLLTDDFVIYSYLTVPEQSNR